MEENSPKKQVVAAIAKATNILVTVSRDPSVDELSAALALTFMLDKVGKHPTAVFSGKIPPAITFLEPEKTFENDTRSLRDFIISLDKAKADRLRYKVEDDVVRIFITPFKTKITEKDLDFSEGDFNVDLVVALGVNLREELDAAISGEARILHDAPIVTINLTAGAAGGFGSTEWLDPTASSFSELVARMSDNLAELSSEKERKPAAGSSGDKLVNVGASNKKIEILDPQISTAILTGVVAATNQFREANTTPEVMSLAAKLMEHGGNQQLIAMKLDEGKIVHPETTDRKTDVEKPASPKTNVAEINLQKDTPSSEPGTLHITRNEDISKAAPTQEERRPIVNVNASSPKVDTPVVHPERNAPSTKKPVVEAADKEKYAEPSSGESISDMLQETTNREAAEESSDALAAAEAELSRAIKDVPGAGNSTGLTPEMKADLAGTPREGSTTKVEAEKHLAHDVMPPIGLDIPEHRPDLATGVPPVGRVDSVIAPSSAPTSEPPKVEVKDEPMVPKMTPLETKSAAESSVPKTELSVAEPVVPAPMIGGEGAHNGSTGEKTSTDDTLPSLPSTPTPAEKPANTLGVESKPVSEKPLPKPPEFNVPPVASVAPVPGNTSEPKASTPNPSLPPQIPPASAPDNTPPPTDGGPQLVEPPAPVKAEAPAPTPNLDALVASATQIADTAPTVPPIPPASTPSNAAPNFGAASSDVNAAPTVIDGISLPPPPPIPDFSKMDFGGTPAPDVSATQVDGLPSLAPPPPAPSFGGPIPPAFPDANVGGSNVPPAPDFGTLPTGVDVPPAPAPDDASAPGQFHIPGQ